MALDCIGITAVDAETVLVRFCKRLKETERLWTLWEANSPNVYARGSDEPVIPFWSSEEKAELYAATHLCGKQLRVVEVSWSLVHKGWYGSLIKKGAEIGIDWLSKESCCLATFEEVVEKLNENAI